MQSLLLRFVCLSLLMGDFSVPLAALLSAQSTTGWVENGRVTLMSLEERVPPGPEGSSPPAVVGGA